jgi:protein N-terminal methyltransferase
MGSSGDGDVRPDSLISKDDGLQYWESVDADDNGMLGGIPEVEGYSSISKIDLQGSRSFLAKLGIGSKNGRRGVMHALEGGAGIGRITEGLLAEVAEHIDVVEPVTKFTAVLKDKVRVRHVYNVGLQEWAPAEGQTYDLVWTQWCVGYLNDEQLVAYLQRCREVLTPEGIIVVKENIKSTGDDLFDELDSSVTRCVAQTAAACCIVCLPSF